MTHYKNKVASRYIPLEISSVGLKMLQSDTMYLSVKKDGHLAFLVSNGKSCYLQNAGGKQWKDLPLLAEAAKKLKGKSCTIAGELYVQSDERSYGFEVPAALSKSTEKLGFGAFDIIDTEKMPEVPTWEWKFKTLSDWLGVSGTVHMIPQKQISSRSDIGPFFNAEVIEGEAEGLVVRHEMGPTYKIKPIMDVDLVVMGYCEGFGEEQGMLRELLLGLSLDKKGYQIVGQVGNGLTNKERKTMFETLKQSPVDSDYMEVSGNNVVFTMIPPEHVVQVKCLDILAETSKGVIRKAQLEWDGKRFGYLGKGLSVSLVAPVIEALRADKKPCVEDAGMDQVNRWLDSKAKPSVATKIKASKLLRREVYVKETKGVKAVRKFLAWKTNKEDSGEWPAFVFSLTDFSPTRKESMKKSLSIASSEKEAMEIFESELKDNVKRGWKPAQD